MKSLRAVIKQGSDQFTAQSDQVQTWLKSQQAKDLVKESPGLKDVFSGAAAAAEVLPKEQEAASKAETKALDRIDVQLSDFRATMAANANPKASAIAAAKLASVRISP